MKNWCCQHFMIFFHFIYNVYRFHQYIIYFHNLKKHCAVYSKYSTFLSNDELSRVNISCILVYIQLSFYFLHYHPIEALINSVMLILIFFLYQWKFGIYMIFFNCVVFFFLVYKVFINSNLYKIQFLCILIFGIWKWSQKKAKNRSSQK